MMADKIHAAMLTVRFISRILYLVSKIFYESNIQVLKHLISAILLKTFCKFFWLILVQNIKQKAVWQEFRSLH